MNRADIEQRLVEIVRGEKDIPNDRIRPEALLSDAGIDSLDSLQILFSIEEAFGISIPDDRARQIKTFGDMTDAIVELTSST
jgi:acyl carrier protein